MPEDHLPDLQPDRRQTLFALGELITATRTVAELLVDTARELHADLDLPVPARAILLELRKEGALTVPDLARRRGVSRQFVQATINPLLVRELVHKRRNPAHRRSVLWELTPRGRQTLQIVMQREGAFLKSLADDLNTEEVAAAAETLQALERSLR